VGYATTAEHEHGADAHWICAVCYDELREAFGWSTPPGRFDKVNQVVDTIGAALVRWLSWHVEGPR
jgi:hypothetical protein